MKTLKVGTKIEIVCDYGALQGVISKFDKKTETITLQSVFDIDTGKEYDKEICLTQQQIHDFIVCNNDYYSDYSFNSKQESLQDLRNEDKHEHEVPNISVSKLNIKESKNNSKITDSFRSVPLNDTIKCTLNNTIKDNNLSILTNYYPHIFINDFLTAISILKRIKKSSSAIGLSLYGDIKRNGFISILSLNFECQTYLIDFIEITHKYPQNEQIFMTKLRKLMLNENITKVIYDSKFICDLLYHKYNITIKNLFDLQVCEATIYRDIYGYYPEKALSLQLLISDFIDSNEHKIPQIDESTIDWLSRPIDPQLRLKIVLETNSLLKVYQFFNRKLLERFIKGCELHQNIVKDCTDHQKLSKYYNNKDRLYIDELDNSFDNQSKKSDKNFDMIKCSSFNDISSISNVSTQDNISKNLPLKNKSKKVTKILEKPKSNNQIHKNSNKVDSKNNDLQQVPIFHQYEIPVVNSVGVPAGSSSQFYSAPSKNKKHSKFF